MIELLSLQENVQLFTIALDISTAYNNYKNESRMLNWNAVNWYYRYDIFERVQILDFELWMINCCAVIFEIKIINSFFSPQTLIKFMSLFNNRLNLCLYNREKYFNIIILIETHGLSRKRLKNYVCKFKDYSMGHCH